MVKAAWNRRVFLELLKVGTPIYAVASVYSLWPTFQRTIILSMMGTKGLGLFALANIVQNMLSTFNTAISNVSFPKMSMAYGSGRSINDIMKMPLKFVVAAMALYSVIALLGWPLLPGIVEFFLPNYIEGIEAAQWMLLVALVSALSIFSNIYMVLKRNHHSRPI